MDIATFKARYPTFTDDVAIGFALEEATLLVGTFNVPEHLIPIGIMYLTAHLLTLPTGAADKHVTKVKAGSAEVSFSDRAAEANWLFQSSYGKLFAQLIERRSKYSGVGVFVS